jgi:DNA-binding transcriptional LysR family regulator
MDIELARTFLKVIDTGSFVRAASSLHLTQAAVSRRIRALEEYLGCELFVRNKAGASLTPPGKRFQRYAAKLVQTMELARYEIGTAPNFDGVLNIGGRFGLWEGYLNHWLNTISEDMPDIQIRAQISFEENLMQDLIDGSLDIGVMYTPQNRPTLQVKPLIEETLILVTTASAEQQTTNPDSYVHVDWGPEFMAKLSSELPELSSPRIVVGISRLGLQRILHAGGSGYFPQRLIQTYLDKKQVFRVLSAPTFKLPTYVVWPTASENTAIEPALEKLHELTQSMQ